MDEETGNQIGNTKNHIGHQIRKAATDIKT